MHDTCLHSNSSRRSHHCLMQLPFMAIVPPAQWRDEHAETIATLEANADALFTPYDVHATLLHLLTFPQVL